MAMQIRVGHSPDSDDAFMFYGIAVGKVDRRGYDFVEVIEDIQSLNRRALLGELETTALSIYTYAQVADRYLLLDSGASMGEGYGPELVSKRPIALEAIRGRRVAIPGLMTSAYLALKLAEPDFHAVEVPFDRVMDAVDNGQADLGLLIHEGQLTYQERGFHSVINLGAWWKRRTGGLPLPLGGNAIRRDLGESVVTDVAAVLRDSIRYSLDHRKEAMAHAMQYARGLDEGLADRFVKMYVNKRTLDYGDDGRQAVRLFLDAAYDRDLLPGKVNVEFAD